MCYALEMSGWGEEGACLLPERDSETRIQSGGGGEFHFVSWLGVFSKKIWMEVAGWGI